jgi:LmbE family N-acetylglucosaminyl deacetylase
MMKSVLCVVAHPDDETIAVAGTLSLMTSQGTDAHIVCATRGEGGELGDPPVCTREELPAVREAELRCAASAIGASGVTFLDYVDPLTGPDDELFPFEADFDALVAQMQTLVREHAPSLVLTHGGDGDYGHPAHILMHQAVKMALENMSDPPLFYTFAARVPNIEDHLWNQNEPAHLALDVRPWLDAKEAAARCHKTQHVLFMRKKDAKTLRDTLRTVEAYHRHLPRLDEGEPPRDPFADLLRAAGAWEPDHRNDG